MQRAVGEDSWESLGLARRSNQSILKETRPEYSLEGLMLKLKLQYFGHLMRRTDSLEKPPILGKIEGGRRRRQRMRWLDDIADSMDMIWGKLLGVGEGQGGLACCSPWVAKSRTRLSNWTELNATTLITLVSDFHTHLNPRRRYIIIAFIGEKAEAQRSN